MGAFSPDQERQRADSLLSASPAAAGTSSGVHEFRTALRAEPHIAISAKVSVANPRATSNWVASHDLRSPLQVAADSLVIVTLSCLSGIAYHGLFQGTNVLHLEYLGTGFVVALLFAGISPLIGGRHAATLTTRYDRLRYATWAWTLTFATLFFLLFALKSGASVSRGAIFTFFVMGLFILSAWRTFSPPSIMGIARKIGSPARECIIIGDSGNSTLDRLAAEFAASSQPAPTIIKFQAACDGLAWPQESKWLIGRVIKAAHALKRGEVYLCTSGVSAERIAGLQRGLNILPRAIYVVPEANVAALVRNKISTVGSHVAIEVRREPLGRVQRVVKRLADIVGAFLAIVILAPFFGAVALAIKLDSPGPVFFRQTRNGYRGKPFKIIKFRTMYVQEDGPVVRQAGRDDPRVTRVGRFLRKSSIDELPQLFNVLMGQMSLVGPRPHAQAHDEFYAQAIENYEVRQHVKPGITGWAQVNGLRGETATLDLMYQRIEYDLWYAVNASMLLDAEILVRTIFEVVRRRNAY